ncbi:class I SAM-dependent methyltransferase [Stenotrophomonas sp. NLF4-10]|uniref:class I SAM-dependent methyltransferase n=1 Tax=Stenotrophomonas sp. NLF4-10 TaxID=2918754 RepID=UPI001EFB7F5D|nr:class I SAM-dependent methyltransferase [Stenotrophomonas sp. NLF4-10]MCG8277542.1 class I SAM-dependent methyltransferase [Stenotrophomonas sp. NLF4-10]
MENRHLLDQLQGVPAQPWLWLAPCSAWRPQPAPAGRGLRLQRTPEGAGWEGDVYCALPLPLPSEAVNAIVLQHPATMELEPLLAECARVLMPGGRLWLTLLNRHSLYRGHWQWRGMRPPTALRCRSGLQREGLRIRTTRHVGPLWNDAAAPAGKVLPALRAVCVLEFEKRTVAFIGPEKAQPVGWRGPVAT